MFRHWKRRCLTPRMHYGRRSTEPWVVGDVKAMGNPAIVCWMIELVLHCEKMYLQK
jgi:hypothetical protein